MDIAIFDSFTRVDTAPKPGPRASDEGSESFADILDTRMRQPEPVRERAPEARAESQDVPDSREGRPASPEAKPNAEAEPEAAPAKPEATGTKPRVKAKNERESENQDSPAPELKTGEAASSTQHDKPTLAPGSAVAAVVAELLNAGGSDTTAGETPMGLLVAAVATQTPAPQQQVPANPILSLLVEDQPVQPVQPAQTTPAPTPATAEPQAATPAAAPTAPATPAGFESLLKAAAPETATATPANTTPTVPAPMPAPAADEVIAAAPAVVAAAISNIMPKADPAAQPGEPTPLEAVMEALAAEDGGELLPALTVKTTAQPAAPPTTPTSPTAYAAQLASQASTAEASLQTAEVVKDMAVEANAVAEKAIDLSELKADGEEFAAIKPQETQPNQAASEPASARATASAEAVQRSNPARPAAAPLAEQVAVRISKAIADGVDKISVKLNPAELGHIEVRMEIGPDGKFNAVFAADRPQTLELLQRDARELARSLQDAGLRADTGSLSFNLRGQNQNHAQLDGPSVPGLHGNTGNGVDLAGDAAPLPAGLYSSANAANGRVDIRV
jgi:flagellar hook-length control protein FliK